MKKTLLLVLLSVMMVGNAEVAKAQFSLGGLARTAEAAAKKAQKMKAEKKNKQAEEEAQEQSAGSDADDRVSRFLQDDDANVGQGRVIESKPKVTYKRMKAEDAPWDPLPCAQYCITAYHSTDNKKERKELVEKAFQCYYAFSATETYRKENLETLQQAYDRLAEFRSQIAPDEMCDSAQDPLFLSPSQYADFNKNTAESLAMRRANEAEANAALIARGIRIGLGSGKIERGGSTQVVVNADGSFSNMEGGMKKYRLDSDGTIYDSRDRKIGAIRGDGSVLIKDILVGYIKGNDLYVTVEDKDGKIGSVDLAEKMICDGGDNYICKAVGASAYHHALFWFFDKEIRRWT